MQQQRSVDVIVVGGGHAALVAALTAHEAGAKVLVLEAAPKDQRGGNSRFSGGIFRFAHGGLDDILPLLTDEDPLGVDGFATHHLPLDEAPQAYETFQKKQDGAIKILLKP